MTNKMTLDEAVAVLKGCDDWHFDTFEHSVAPWDIYNAVERCLSFIEAVRGEPSADMENAGHQTETMDKDGDWYIHYDDAFEAMIKVAEKEVCGD